VSAQSRNDTALITGASSGIGAIYADRLAKRGYDLILVARDQARLDGLASRLQSQTGVRVETLKADLTLQADVIRVEQRVRQDDSIVMLVNNAGVGPEGPLVDGDADYLDRMILINVVAVNRLSVAAATAFAKRGKGTIINLASVVALIPEMFNGTYSATKAFVLNLTQALNTEVGCRRCFRVSRAPRSSNGRGWTSRSSIKAGSWTSARWSTRRSPVSTRANW
jgi:short-subunit dehydrogenase